MKNLATVLAHKERLYRDAILRLRELASEEAENEVYDLTALLSEAATLTGCLRRLVEGKTAVEIHRAFGAPGDFGYETPLGDALWRIYQGKDGAAQ